MTKDALTVFGEIFYVMTDDEQGHYILLRSVSGQTVYAIATGSTMGVLAAVGLSRTIFIG